jgi:thiol-disulfide isomerase/thioredoxin
MEKRTILLVIVLLGVVGAISYLEKDKATPPAVEDAVQFGSDALTATQQDAVETTSQKETAQALQEENPFNHPTVRRPLAQWEASLRNEDKARIASKASLYPQAPELKGIAGYINAEEGLQISDFRGKVVLIDFWTYTCINCIRTLPHVVEWDKKYRDKGLVIIGVHTPEFDFEHERENVVQAVKTHGIEYRVVQDNAYLTWREFKNRFWPRKYLIDADGFIRYDHIGEGAYQETEEMIKALLEEQGVDVGDMPASELEDETPTTRNTPELYAGYNFALPRGQDIGNAGGLKPNEDVEYVLPTTFKPHTIYLEGKWRSNPDDLEAVEDNAAIFLVFTAKDANIVAHSPALQKIKIYINNEPILQAQAGSDVENSETTISEPRLYNVVEGEYGSYTLKLVVGKGFAFSAFTFG